MCAAGVSHVTSWAGWASSRAAASLPGGGPGWRARPNGQAGSGQAGSGQAGEWPGGGVFLASPRAGWYPGEVWW
jgi:hypothetical protein